MYRATRVSALGHSPANCYSLSSDSTSIYAWRDGNDEKKTPTGVFENTGNLWQNRHSISKIVSWPQCLSTKLWKNVCFSLKILRDIDFIVLTHEECASFLVNSRILRTQYIRRDCCFHMSLTCAADLVKLCFWKWNEVLVTSYWHSVRISSFVCNPPSISFHKHACLMSQTGTCSNIICHMWADILQGVVAHAWRGHM